MDNLPTRGTPGLGRPILGRPICHVDAHPALALAQRAMAELHVFGQVVGAGGFSLPSLFCKWSIEAGSNFRLLQGLSKGQTQCDQPNDDEMAVWAHPVDVHYSTKGIDGWPRLCVEVWGIDTFGRYEIAGYGCCVLPAASGHHQLKCLTWRPIGSAGQRVSSAAPPGPTACAPSRTRAPTHARARRSFLPWGHADAQAQQRRVGAVGPVPAAHGDVRRGVARAVGDHEGLPAVPPGPESHHHHRAAMYAARPSPC